MTSISPCCTMDVQNTIQGKIDDGRDRAELRLPYRTSKPCAAVIRWLAVATPLQAAQRDSRQAEQQLRPCFFSSYPCSILVSIAWRHGRTCYARDFEAVYPTHVDTQRVRLLFALPSGDTRVLSTCRTKHRRIT